MDNNSLNNLRSYRIDLESSPIYNNIGKGISLFDILSAFAGVFILERLIYYITRKHMYNLIPSRRKISKPVILYLLVIPFGVLVHRYANTKTYLSGKLFDDTCTINIYQKIYIGIILSASVLCLL